MADGKRKPLIRHSPDVAVRKTRRKRTKGFVRKDQRLPESPPLSNVNAPSGGLMAAVRARYRDAVDLLFGSVPNVLNSTCISTLAAPSHALQTAPQLQQTQTPPVAKRKRHPADPPDPFAPFAEPQPTNPPTSTDQVVPHQNISLSSPDSADHHTACPSTQQCSCVNALWNADGIGPELMLRTAEELSENIIVLYGNAIDSHTGDVNYSSLLHSPNFHQYLISAQKLRYFDPLLLNEVERKAFFLNVYNSLMIHAIAVMSKPRTMFERISLYNTAAYNIGGRPYSLNAIEHGVLRANRRGNGPFAQPQFSGTDARRQCMLPDVDPRIHFALNCGAKSCPSVRFYEASTIDKTLDVATRAYLVDLEVSPEARTITLPKLLQWYQADFCDDGEVDSIIKWALPYLEDKKRESINSLLREKEENNQGFKVTYAEYDWTVNDSSL